MSDNSNTNLSKSNLKQAKITFLQSLISMIDILLQCSRQMDHKACVFLQHKIGPCSLVLSKQVLTPKATFFFHLLLILQI